MKYLSKTSPMPLLVLGAGIVGALARAGLYAFGKDASGLLIRNHPLDLICWVLTICVAVCVAAAVWKLGGSNNYKENFPVNKKLLTPAVLAACGILLSVLQGADQPMDQLDLIRLIFGIGAVPAVVFAAQCRRNGRRPAFFLYGVLCLYYAIHLLCQYRVWSGSPQLPDYSFPLFACVFLTLTAYQHMAFCAGLGRRRMQIFCSLMAAFLCFLSAVGSDDPMLYLTSGYWAASNLCTLEAAAQQEDGESV